MATYGNYRAMVCTKSKNSNPDMHPRLFEAAVVMIVHTWWSPIATWFNDWIKAQRWNPRCSSASGGSHENGDNIPTMNWMAAPAVSLRWRKPRGIGAILPLVTSQVVHVYKGYISGIMCPHPHTEHSYNEKPVLKQCLILKICAKKPWC